MLNEGALGRLRSWVDGLLGASRRGVRLALPPGTRSAGEARASIRVVRDAIERRRALLDRIDEAPEEISSAAVLAIVRHHLPAEDRARLVVDGDLDLAVLAPVESLAEALGAVVTNALEASARDRDVEVLVERGAGVARFVVSDRGDGIPRRVREHLGEPFFTTKPRGAAMGLGLFLAQAVAELSSGTLEIESVEHEGTRVVLTMPLAPEAAQRQA